MRHRSIFLLVALLVGGALVLRAQERVGAPVQPPTQPPSQPQAAAQPPVTPESPDETAALRAQGAAFIAAFNARDAKKIASLWTPEARYFDPSTGDEMAGREEIEAEFAATFEEPEGAKLTVDVESLDFLSPGVAIQRGFTHVSRPDLPQEDSKYTAVFVKRDGQWLIDRVTEEELRGPKPSNYEHLRELEWMIGSWVDDNDPGVRVHTDVEWTKNRNFMTRAFAVVIGDQVDVSGMQVVGWDESTKQIRSWVFDSDGGFGEGVWSRKDNRWLVKNTGTLPDGGKTSSVHVFTKLDDASYKWQSINRDVDGELLPNIPEVLIVRVPQ